MNKKSGLTFLWFLLVFIVLGLWREYVFVNINNVIYFKYYKYTTAPIPFGFGWLTRYSYSTLYYIKYPLTVLFVLVYFGLNFYFLKKIKVSFFYIKILMLAYIVIVLMSAVLMLYAYYFHHRLNGDAYLVSRGLMGLAQSPLIGFVLFALYLWDKNKLHQNEKRNSSF